MHDWKCMRRMQARTHRPLHAAYLESVERDGSAELHVDPYYLTIEAKHKNTIEAENARTLPQT